MSTKKTKTNGAVHAPASPVLADKTAAKNSPKTNGKSTKATATVIQTTSEMDVINSRELLKVLAEMRSGNFSVRLPNDALGLSGKIYDTLNDILNLNEILVKELTVARKVIGKQGKLNHRVEPAVFFQDF